MSTEKKITTKEHTVSERNRLSRSSRDEGIAAGVSGTTYDAEVQDLAPHAGVATDLLFKGGYCHPVLVVLAMVGPDLDRGDDVAVGGNSRHDTDAES